MQLLDNELMLTRGVGGLHLSEGGCEGCTCAAGGSVQQYSAEE